MDTLKAIVSKANSIRFAHINGLMPSFDNTLSSDEYFSPYVTSAFKHEFFVNDEVLVQIKTGLTATHTLNKVYQDGSETLISVTNTTTYTDFKILDFVITLSSAEEFYLLSETEESTWKSECVSVFTNPIDAEYMLIEWTNLDVTNDSYEFDYTTADSIDNVNYMRIKGQLMTYKPKNESTIFDNQNEVTKIKANLFRVLTAQFAITPRPVAEKIIIAMQHDLFNLNQVPYVIEESPELDSVGAWVNLSADLTVVDSLGFNTHDIGYDCDSTGGEDVENKVADAATGNGSFSVSDGYGLTQIIVKKISGTPLIKFGTTVSGDDLLTERTIVDIDIDSNRYTPDVSGTWTIYYTLSGGTVDIRVQTINFN